MARGRLVANRSHTRREVNPVLESHRLSRVTVSLSRHRARCLSCGRYVSPCLSTNRACDVYRTRLSVEMSLPTRIVHSLMARTAERRQIFECMGFRATCVVNNQVGCTSTVGTLKSISQFDPEFPVRYVEG